MLMATENELPHAFCKDGGWHFAHADMRVPLAGEFGDETFLGHYRALCRVLGVGNAHQDPRFVYFIGWEDGPIKIGVAGNLAVRLRTLQVACPYDLRVEAVATGGLPAERKYHERFAGLRLRNEWFDRHPDILAEIDRLNAGA